MNISHNITLLILLLPLFGFLAVGLFRLPKIFSAILANAVILASFIGSAFLFFTYSAGNANNLVYYNWISIQQFSIPFALQIDTLSLTMMMIVSGVSFLIHVYSIGYMWHDEGFDRFFSYMNLFVFFMLLLVMGNNYLVMFVGWEGVGLCSYLLIGFWFKNTEYNNAARKAFIMNRIGDLGFLLGMFLLMFTFGSLDFNTVFTKAAVYPKGDLIITVATMLLFVGAIGKSAQIPLYTWLPDAMAGPTPVSALIHAATMVTAGIYMVVRSNVLFSLAPVTMQTIMVIGVATAFLAATIALYQNDIKKVLAYSTVSQLGLMFVALGVGAYSTAMFHLTTHAFFKALLFLAAGSVIHALDGEQDIRNMGGLTRKLPITFTVFLIASLAISGIPPFAGFFSKDEILMFSYQQSPILWATASAVSIMTTFYMFRLLFLAFGRSYRGQSEHIHESPMVMTIPLMILAILSAVGGFINIPSVLGGTHVFKHWLSSVTGSEVMTHLSHTSEYGLMGIATLFAVVSIIVAWWLFVSRKRVPVPDDIALNPVGSFLKAKWYVDEFYQAVVVKPLGVLSQWFYERVELLGFDRLVNGVGKLTFGASSLLRYAQQGNVGFYMLMMVLAIAALLIGNLLY